MYQMKLTLARQDYVRTQILSRKISKRAIAAEGLERQCITYYQFMAKYYIHEKESLDTAKSYQTIFETLEKITDAALKSEEEGTMAFRNFILYLLITPQSEEKIEILTEMEKKYPRQLEQEELLTKYVRKFLTFELVPLKEDEIRG